MKIEIPYIVSTSSETLELTTVHHSRQIIETYKHIKEEHHNLPNCDITIDTTIVDKTTMVSIIKVTETITY